MNDTSQTTPEPEPNKRDEIERTKQVTVAGWTAGFTAFFALMAAAGSPAWPTAIGVTAVAAMVAVTCYFILRRG